VEYTEHTAPWSRIGWNQAQWNAFVTSCAIDMVAFDGGMKTAEQMHEIFGPNETTNPLWDVKQKFIAEKQRVAQSYRDDDNLKQAEYDKEAERRQKARDKADRAKQQARADGELTEAGEAFKAKLLDGMMTGDELDDMPEPDPIIDGWLYTDSINFLAGPSGTFKTFVAHDLAARYASHAMTYHGIPMTHGKVFYIIAEGSGMFKFRKRAWESHNGKVSSNITYYPCPIQLDDFEAQMPALISVARGGGYSMVIFDTQAMCTPGVDENAAKDMTRIISAVHQLREATKGCVLMVHHFDKGNNGIRGSGSQFAAANTVLATVRKGDEEWVKLSTKKSDGGKAKEDEGRDDLKFKLEKWQPEETDAAGRPLRGSIFPLRDDTWAPTEPKFTPTVDPMRLAFLRALDAIDGLTSSQLAQVMEEVEPKASTKHANSGAKKWVAKDALSKAKLLLTNETAVKVGAKYVITDLGHEVLLDAATDDDE